MRIPVTFIILGIGLALLYLVFKDDDTSGEWKSAVVTITSRIPGSGTVDYYNNNRRKPRPSHVRG